MTVNEILALEVRVMNLTGKYPSKKWLRDTVQILREPKLGYYIEFEGQPFTLIKTDEGYDWYYSNPLLHEDKMEEAQKKETAKILKELKKITKNLHNEELKKKEETLYGKDKIKHALDKKQKEEEMKAVAEEMKRLRNKVSEELFYIEK